MRMRGATRCTRSLLVRVARIIISAARTPNRCHWQGGIVGVEGRTERMRSVTIGAAVNASSRILVRIDAGVMRRLHEIDWKGLQLQFF
jgi:hypothetical protein